MSDLSKPPLLIILGPTASGKTKLATQVARAVHGEILSADSRQIYRDMDIGTGKDLGEYFVNGHQIPYHLINIREAGEQYNVSDFHHDFANAYEQIAANGTIPIVCGGTGFYIYSLLKGHAFASVPVDEVLRKELEILPTPEILSRFNATESAYHAFADISTRKRLIRAVEIAEFLKNTPDQPFQPESRDIQYPAILFGLQPLVEVRRERISKRLQERLNHGLVEEVGKLLENGLTPEQLIYYGLEYKYITQYLTGESTYDFMITKLETEIHRYAKRQMTFFRKMEKDGLTINWLEDGWNDDRKIQFITERYWEFKNNLAGIE
ncbi:tRNA (adenosine(37)-N6)-dimethylallyltransferase MiaA [Dyadobacter sp. CY323]|uniref:tRNA (adenosine(37)-N6)-dimethylallyltransferase MiaA n=1 Tax=Dyadobacter sp. CY323 TaxID=2907302 RepID=UPI001EFFA9DE|nr:tRNA (adenosine(37)-N6)-dimethylallyltransferase MiaA [Dyadobacter sp. CY323]MCE6992065.1 tRNA (adenosine(37)-N6)-dimethylallyltransferase MiaA [Dyadobacter sp. CY323]